MKPLGREAQPLTDEQRKIVEDYLNSRLSYKEVSVKYGKPASTVMYWVKKYRKEQKGDNKE